MKITVFWDDAPDSLVDIDRSPRGASIITSSEMSVNLYYTTWCSIPEYSHLHVRRFAFRGDTRGVLKCMVLSYKLSDNFNNFQDEKV
jgi:hypothetical protein